MKNLLIYFLAIILILLPCFSDAQHVRIDSLQNLLKISKEDTTKVNALNALSGQYRTLGNYELALQHGQDAQDRAININYQNGIASSYINIGNVFYFQGDYEKALNNYLKSLKIRMEIGDKKGIANSYTGIGNIYFYQGNYEKALDSHLKSLTIKEEIGDKKGMPSSYNNIGGVYLNQGNFEKSLFNYQKSLNISKEIGDKNGIAMSYNNIGLIYYRQENYEKALNNHLEALKIRDEIGDKNGKAMSYNNIGLIYWDKKNYEKALSNYLKSLKINEAIGNKRGIGLSYMYIGSIYTKQAKFEKSYYYLNQSLMIFNEIGYKDGAKEAYFVLSDLYDKKNDYKQALNFHKLYSNIKDTLLNEQSSKQIAEMNTKYDSEKKDKDLIKKDAEISKQQAETEKQNLQRNAFIIGFALVIVLAFFIFRGYRQKQNANKLLEEKNGFIEKQKQLVEEKNGKITDSINYAKRIQHAILPSQALIKSFLPESFIFFRPKDIVSGDFYWFSEKKDKLLIAVADCTGHGVPGAFMSMIGNTLLNEIVNVKNIVKPGEILNELNKGVVSLLHQNSHESSTQDDGMDITVLAIDKASREIEFAGANHFSYLFNHIKSETLQGDLFSIGGMFGKLDINFTSKKIKVEKGNTLYLFTDGFIDQFGGEKNSKFLSGRFEHLLQNGQQQGMEQQLEMLISAFDDWKGNNKQLDDVLVVGIRL